MASSPALYSASFFWYSSLTSSKSSAPFLPPKSISSVPKLNFLLNNLPNLPLNTLPRNLFAFKYESLNSSSDCLDSSVWGTGSGVRGGVGGLGGCTGGVISMIVIILMFTLTIWINWSITVMSPLRSFSSKTISISPAFFSSGVDSDFIVISILWVVTNSIKILTASSSPPFAFSNKSININTIPSFSSIFFVLSSEVSEVFSFSSFFPEALSSSSSSAKYSFFAFSNWFHKAALSSFCISDFQRSSSSLIFILSAFSFANFVSCSDIFGRESSSSSSFSYSFLVFSSWLYKIAFSSLCISDLYLSFSSRTFSLRALSLDNGSTPFSIVVGMFSFMILMLEII